jgi:hypothetical protein
LDTYEKAFAEIRKVTGTHDIGELVQRFKAVEDQNFSLFNYVNEVNNEIEKLAEEIVDVQRNIDAMKIESVAADEEMKRTMRTLEVKLGIQFGSLLHKKLIWNFGKKESLNSSNEKCGMYEKQYSEITFDLQDMKGGIEHVMDLFQKATNLSMIKKSRPTTAASQSQEQQPTQEDGEAPPPAQPTGTEEEDASTDSGAATSPSSSKPSTSSTAAKAKQEFVMAANALLGSHGVTDTNLLSVLGLVEQKTNELLTLHYIYNVPKKGGSAAPQPPSTAPGEDKSGEGVKEAPVVYMPVGGVGGLLGQGPMVPVGNLSITAPSTGDDHDSEDNMSEEDDRPLSREELKQKTLKGVSCCL